jgi:hypothetical protein
MKIQKIIGEQGAMPQLCGGGKCPSVIIADDGNAYVQGYQLGAGDNAVLVAPAGEGFVKMPIATLKKIAAQVAVA